jgi:hypothetical protein
MGDSFSNTIGVYFTGKYNPKTGTYDFGKIDTSSPPAKSGANITTILNGTNTLDNLGPGGTGNSGNPMRMITPVGGNAPGGGMNSNVPVSKVDPWTLSTEGRWESEWGKEMLGRAAAGPDDIAKNDKWRVTDFVPGELPDYWGKTAPEVKKNNVAPYLRETYNPTVSNLQTILGSQSLDDQKKTLTHLQEKMFTNAEDPLRYNVIDPWMLEVTKQETKRLQAATATSKASQANFAAFQMGQNAKKNKGAPGTRALTISASGGKSPGTGLNADDEEDSIFNL